MTEAPLENPDGTMDPPDGAQLPGPEDGPVTAPRDEPLPANDGDLDVGDTPPGGDIGDGEAPAFDRSRAVVHAMPEQMHGRPARSMASRLSRVLAGSMLIASMVLIGSSTVVPLAVGAADGCGSGWHKQSDGKLAATQTNASGQWSAKATLSGWVRYCTRERRFMVDQKNQRVYIGIPTQILTRGLFAGAGRTKECLTTKIRINAKHIPSGSSISIGFSGKSPSGSVTTSTTSTSKTSSYTFCATSPRTTTTLQNSVVGVRATVPNCGVNLFSPVITSVTISVSATMRYKTGTTEGSRTAAAANTDKSTWSTFSC